MLRVAGTINLANADQTVGDLTSVVNFQNVDASGLSTGVSITGTSGVNIITGGSGGDSVDGGGGADVISTGGGNDTVVYHGTEASIDGGGGSDTLVLAAMGGITAVDFSVAAGSDQTTGDTLSVTNFENLNASIATIGLTVTASAGGSYITTGSGNDTITGGTGGDNINSGAGDDAIDGKGGGDVISAGAGNDTVYYYGSESSIDGGSGTNTLILKAAVTINLGNADQTTGDLATITNFQNVDGSAVTTGMSMTGSSGANVITGGSGDDTIDGGGGADIIDGGAGNDTIYYYSTATSINGGTR